MYVRTYVCMYVCMYVCSLGPSPRVLKELGPTRGLPSANWGVHTYIPCMLVAGLALQSNDWGVKSVRANSAFHPSGVGTWAGGNLKLARRELLGLTKGLKLGSYRSGPGGYYSGTLVTVVTAILKAVSLLGGTCSGYRAPSAIV